MIPFNTNAIPSPISKLNRVVLTSTYNTMIVTIKMIVSIVLLKSKYQNPIAKQNLNITPNIMDEIKSDILCDPLAYQEIYPKNGDINVIVYQIII